MIPNVWCVTRNERSCPLAERRPDCRRAMSRDASVYEDPDDFKPERFLGLSPEALEQTDPSNYVFGHGRRCALFKTSVISG